MGAGTEFQKYPMSLYKDGDRNAEHQVVADQDAENAARSDGYRMIGEPAPEPAAPEKKNGNGKAKKDAD